ncbi:MAG: ribosomal protein S18-alanine N-acetyltransferase [bacterium]|nr:ribosomal protein S18-alanine N-acetyltransferase [bacterium]
MSASTNPDCLRTELREMTEDDLPTILEMERACFTDPWPPSAFDEILRGDNWVSLVAEAEGVIVGYSCHFEVGRGAHLANVAVDPAYRRKSVAKRLLERILDLTRANGCYQIQLEVRPSNESACRFYQDAGFEELHRRPNYYRSPVEEAVVMRLRLDDDTSDE